MISVIALIALVPSPAEGPRETPEVASGLPLVVQDDFETGLDDRWRFTDPEAWTVAEQDGDHVLELHKRRSDYEPPVRSPYNMALIRGADLEDFVLDLKVRSTIEDYGHRDLCLFFGYQDPSHFYYVHLGKEADPHAHSIFLVDDAPRVSIAEQRTDGTPWTDGWHHVRIVREIDSGLVEVYFDDMETPVMTTHDETFSHGLLGVGSFDDTGQFDDLRIWGRQAD